MTGMDDIREKTVQGKISEMRKRLKGAHNMKGYGLGIPMYKLWLVIAIAFSLPPVQLWSKNSLYIPQAFIWGIVAYGVYPGEFAGITGRCGTATRALLKYLPFTRKQLCSNLLRSRLKSTILITLSVTAFQIVTALLCFDGVNWLNIAMPITVHFIIPAAMSYVTSRV